MSATARKGQDEAMEVYAPPDALYSLCTYLVVRKLESTMCCGSGTESSVRMCVILNAFSVSMCVAAVRLPARGTAVVAAVCGWKYARRAYPERDPSRFHQCSRVLRQSLPASMCPHLEACCCCCAVAGPSLLQALWQLAPCLCATVAHTNRHKHTRTETERYRLWQIENCALYVFRICCSMVTINWGASALLHSLWFIHSSVSLTFVSPDRSRRERFAICCCCCCLLCSTLSCCPVHTKIIPMLNVLLVGRTAHDVSCN